MPSLLISRYCSLKFYKQHLNTKTMLIKTFAATAAVPSFRALEIEKGVQKLIIKKSSAWTTSETLTMGIYRDGVKLKDLCVNHELVHLNAFSGFGKTNGVFADVSLTATNAYIVVELAPNTYQFDNKTKLVIDFNGGVDTKTYTFFAIASGTTSPVLCVYERGVLTIGNTSKTIDVRNSQLIAIDSTFTQLTLQGDNHVSNILSLEELNVLDRLNSDWGYIGIGVSGALTATDDSLIMQSVNDIQSVILESNGASNIVFTNMSFIGI